MIIFAYVLPTIAALVVVGYYAPFVGIFFGVLFHILVTLLKISKQLDKISRNI